MFVLFLSIFVDFSNHPLIPNDLNCSLAGMSKYAEALADYEKVVELEPANKAARLEVDKLREKCAAVAAHAAAGAAKKPAAQLDLKANISRMFASEGGKERLNGANKAEAPIIAEEDPHVVLPVVKPPHLRYRYPRIMVRYW